MENTRELGRRCCRVAISLHAAVIIFSSTQVSAEELPSEEDFLGEVPVVLSVTRLKQPRAETPASITIIDRKMIDASGAQEIPDLLRLVPGFQVGHLNDARTTVTYHGFSDEFARRMQVLIDGRSVYTPMFGGVNWADLAVDIEDIERIEIIRGPNSVTYGANSFLAVINIITRHSSSKPGQEVMLTGGNHGVNGDNGMEKVMYRFSGGTKKFTYRVTASKRKDDGFRNINDTKEVSLLTFRGDYQASNRDSIEIQFGFNDGIRQTGAISKTTDPLRDITIDSNFQQIKWTRQVKQDESVSVQFYHNYYDSQDSYQFPFSIFTAVPIEGYKTERYNIEFQHTLKPHKQWRIVWGAEARLDKVTAAGWLNSSSVSENNVYRLFVNGEWRFRPKWIMNIGTMVEKNDLTGTDVSPRVALNYRLSPQNTFRFVHSRATRTPSILEERANSRIFLMPGGFFDQLFLSDGNLKPEKIKSNEIGYLFQSKSKKVLMDLKLFWDEIDDVIALAADPLISDNLPFPLPSNGAGVFINGGEAKIRGAEVEFRYSPTPKTRFILALAYANQRGTIVTDINPTVIAQTKTTTPVHTQSLMVIHEFPKKILASVTIYKMSNMSFGLGDNTSGYNSVDMRVAKKFKTRRINGEVAVIGQNLTGDYFDADLKFVFDKRFFLALKLGF